MSRVVNAQPDTTQKSTKAKAIMSLFKELLNEYSLAEEELLVETSTGLDDEMEKHEIHCQEYERRMNELLKE